jgi:VWFA-related protein
MDQEGQGLPNMPHSVFARRNIQLLMIVVLFGLCSSLRGQNPSGQSPAPSPEKSNSDKPEPSQQPSARVPADNSEVSSEDSPPTFKVRVNLVLVRVIVRDAQGKVVPNLRKEDFQLFDNRKPQAITTFSIETPESQALKAATSPTPADDGANASGSSEPTKLPQRFVALFFDDAHLTMEDASFVRDAGTRFFSSMAPSDRVGVFTSSGQFTQPFTADHEVLQKSLLSIVPRSMLHASGFHDCPDVSYYQADQIENRHDDQAMSIAVEDAVQCAFGGDESKVQLALPMASSAANRALSIGDQETQNAYRHMEDAMRRLAQMPGQRIMVFVSPGFILSTLRSESSDLVDRANRASVVINTIDARGLYTPQLLGDIADPQQDSPKTSSLKSTYRLATQQAQSEILEQLAYGTGGTYFHNRNDLDEGLRQAGAAPAISYVLGFSPQNMKVDGHFHGLKVTLTNKQQKYSLQTRNGYYAPKSVADPGQAAKLEIQEAIFSQEEMHDVPVDLQTQFFKKDAVNARLSVLTHFDLKSIHFRKVEGRNNDNLTIATAIFDENGNFVTGGEKTVQMRLLDTTYNRLSRSGLTLKSSYDVKPGTYMVRLVVRDGEGSQMAARNGAVIIPY